MPFTQIPWTLAFGEIYFEFFPSPRKKTVFSITVLHLSKLNYHLNNTVVYPTDLTQIAPFGPVMSFIAKGNPGSCPVFSCHVSLLCNTASLEPLFVIHNVDVAEAFICFVGCPSIWVCLTGFLMIGLRLYTPDRNAVEVLFCPQCILSGGTCWFVPILGILSSVTLLRWCLLGTTRSSSWFLLCN